MELLVSFSAYVYKKSAEKKAERERHESELYEDQWNFIIHIITFNSINL